MSENPPREAAFGVYRCGIGMPLVDFGQDAVEQIVSCTLASWAV
jgi:hypothetical protein